ncbi:NUDIX domain-containing protein [Paenibacillus polygoni]|uniref:NUDIX domain-containing protein n=1 Tax=Paenibacillus polygoni TaxID=3050112 RepID=A0ABY8XC28_9BACL|nr:NUDIX domain-containing protein [Paenibacillus polygoni]WIV21086.1 NUDIX domain-containing protein [Paenibacillus polygoni]
MKGAVRVELIAEISDIDLGLMSSNLPDQVHIRKAARAIILNESNQIALLYVSEKNYHKLPGGGVEANETWSEALQREVKEEVGATIEMIANLGSIIEHRGRHHLIQQSCCYLARAVEMSHTPSFTKEEQANGFQLKWMNYDQAVSLIKHDKPKDYVGQFIQKRDFLFLQKVKMYCKGM